MSRVTPLPRGRVPAHAASMRAGSRKASDSVMRIERGVRFSRAAVEIAKALSEQIRILVLDEPTAALPDKEVGSLFSIVRRLAKSGAAILFISYRLDEVFEIGDRVTVLRDGRKVATHAVAAVTKDRLIEMMVGRHVDETARQRLTIRKPALEVRGWSRRGVFADVTFSVGHGEILGFAGLVGSGGSDVARSLFAIEPCDAGELRIDRKVVKPRSQHQMMACGLAFVPGDRQREGLFSEWSLTRNITLPVLGRISSWASIPRRRIEEEIARRYISRLDLRPGAPSELVRTLSGGNQQKVLLSKWLASNPKVLILEDPTAGIDIGAKMQAHRLVDALACEGMALIVVSSDLSELISIADRILVFAQGRIEAEMEASEASREAVMRAASDAWAAPAPAMGGRALLDGAGA